MIISVLANGDRKITNKDGSAVDVDPKFFMSLTQGQRKVLAKASKVFSIYPSIEYSHYSGNVKRAAGICVKMVLNGKLRHTDVLENGDVCN